MRLNLVSRAIITESAVIERGLKDINTLIGGGTSVGEDAFKFSFVNEGSEENLLISKADLGELFKDIPQDISEVSLKTSLLTDLSMLEKNLKLDPSRNEYPAYNTAEELLETGNVFSDAFNTWVWFVGISDLPRNEVELSIEGNYLTIQCKNATCYKGSVLVKFRNLSEAELIAIEEEHADEPVL